jgi:hypothetical protein
MSLTNSIARSMPIPRPMVTTSGVKTQALKAISTNRANHLKPSMPAGIDMPKKAAFQKTAIIGKVVGSVVGHNMTNFNSIIPFINSRLADNPEEKEMWKHHAVEHLHVGPMTLGQGKKIINYKKFDAPKNLYPSIENQKKLLP